MHTDCSSSPCYGATAACRSAALGLGAALFSEVLTQQSVASQMLGRCVAEAVGSRKGGLIL